tara:strand:+ start:64 stop:723 length:660 start_codon:yes stop_codon:yes gene_type:complete
MIESIRHFFDLIFDKSKSWGFKTATTISILGLLVLLDLGFGFSYDFQVINQLEQLEKIQVLKKEFKDEPKKLAKIKSLEEKTLSKEHYSDFFTRKFNDLITNETIPIDNGIEEKEINEDSKRSLFWMVITSNFFFVLIFPFLLFVPIFSRDGRKANSLVGWFASIILIGVIVSFVTWISYQIPLIDNNPKWNYIVNFIIHILFFGAIAKYSNSNDKQKN